jgi:integrase
MAEGIDIRHARSCRSKGVGSCNCTPTFQAHVWDAKEGKRIRKTFPTRSAAKRWRQDSIVGLRSGALSADRGPRFEDAVDAWLDGLRAGHITTRSGDRYKPATIRAYESCLKLRAVPTLKHRRLAEVTTKDVQALVDGLVKDGLASATIDADLTPLKALYRRAVGRGEVRVNPTVGIEKPAVRTRARRVVPHTDAEAMLSTLDPRDRALWAVSFYAGLRMGELSALGRADIDLGAGVIQVHRGWDAMEGYIPTKNRKARSVPVAAVLRDHLDEHLLSTGAVEHVFGDPRWVRRAGVRAHKRWEDNGLPIVDLHEARHTYASFAIAAGLNAKTLSTYMGHATIQITLDLYGHLFPGAEAEAAGLLDVYFARSIGAPTVAPTVAHLEQTAA